MRAVGRCTDRDCRGGPLCPAGGGVNCAAWSGDSGMSNMPSSSRPRCVDRSCPGGVMCPAGGGVNCAAWSSDGYGSSTPVLGGPAGDFGGQPTAFTSGKATASRSQPQLDEMPRRPPQLEGRPTRMSNQQSIPQMRQQGRTAQDTAGKVQSLSGQSLADMQASVASMRSNLRMVESGQMPKQFEEDLENNYRQNRALQSSNGVGPRNTYADEYDTGDEDHEEDEDEYEEHDDTEDDDAELYLTDAAQKWECIFLQRVAKCIHRLVCQHMNNVEESIFNQFLVFDKNLDGTLARAEAEAFLRVVESVIPRATKSHRHIASHDGSISFIAFLKWCSDNAAGTRASTIGFNLSSVVGGGESNLRIEALSFDDLKRNVIGYRRLLRQLRTYCDKRRIAAARNEENTLGLRAAMQVYYDVLAKDFEGDEEHLFELFNEVDESGNLQLEAEEVEKLVRLLDTGATSGDIRRYLAEINVADGYLSFAALVDWWDQAGSNPMSLMSEKGAVLVASVKASAAKRRLGGWLTESWVQASWRKADEENQLPSLRDAYKRVILEFGEYKIDRALRAAENDSAEL